MKILQLIDSLNPGGAERMAVSYANSLSEIGVSSYLITTRAQGEFLNNLGEKIKYYHLDRRKTFDYKAILRLVVFIKKNDINIVHAHGTSWFIASLCKIKFKNFKLIWHNHHGNSPNMPFLKEKILLIFSNFFDGIISVNPEMQSWSRGQLKFKNSIYLPNFVNPTSKNPEYSSKKRFNIVCTANLRQEKNHLLLLKAVDIVKSEINLQVHFIGRDFKDDYSTYIKQEFEKRKGYVNFYDTITDPYPILLTMDLGILVSTYEGMPMAILEYGAASLPVISTDVGVCKELLKNRGILIPSQNLDRLVNAIETYAFNTERAKTDSIKFHNFIMSNYASKVTIPRYLEFVRNLC